MPHLPSHASPRVCPGPVESAQPDCGLIAHRVPYGSDESLRRAVLHDRSHYRSMAELVWADMNRQGSRVALPVPAEPIRHPMFPIKKGVVT